MDAAICSRSRYITDRFQPDKAIDVSSTRPVPRSSSGEARTYPHVAPARARGAAGRARDEGGDLREGLRARRLLAREQEIDRREDLEQMREKFRNREHVPSLSRS